MRLAKFTIDVYEGQSFDGFSRDEDWNGWACPYFTFEQGLKVMEAHLARGWKAKYNESEDQFVFDFSHDGNDEPDAFTAEQIEGKKLYPLGAFCWIWEEEPQEVAEAQ